MKNLFMFLAIFCSFICKSQTYYNPSQQLDINITVREPFKPINYAEIGQNFNNVIQAELAKREALKEYYENIYYETKNSIIENSIFTNDYNIDKLIYKLQSNTLAHIDHLYRLLTQGQKEPKIFESDLKIVYYEYNNSNRQLAYISKYKYQKINTINSPNDLSEFNLIFEKVINIISSFNFDYQGNINFEVEKIIYDGSKSTNNILTFISMVCDKQINLDDLKLNYENKVKNEMLKERMQNKEIAKKIFDYYDERSATLNSMNDNERKKYLKNELKYIKKTFNRTFLQDYISSSDDFFPENILFNIIDKKIILNKDEVDDSKIIYNEKFFKWSKDLSIVRALSNYFYNESGVRIINP